MTRSPIVPIGECGERNIMCSVSRGRVRWTPHAAGGLLLMLIVTAAMLPGNAAPSSTGQDAPWKPLFNGRDLDGWEHVGPGNVMVENGMLKTQGGMGLLWYTREMLSNVVLRVVYRNPDGVNSGVFIRIPEKPTEPWMPVNRGYEVQIDDRENEYHVTGVLYSLTRAAGTPPRHDWNTMDISLDGDRTMVTINGVLVTDYREGQPVPPKKEEWEPDRGPRPAAGYIGVQNHSDEDVVYFREISVRPIAR